MTRRILSAAAAFAALCTAASAEPEILMTPQYFTVTGVAANDVLNIRAEASGSAEIVGALAPGAGPVEVVMTDGDWGRVSAGDQSGWVSMKFLQPRAMETLPETPIPAGLRCLGTEPFWSLTLDAGSLRYSDPEGAALSLPLSASGSFVARPHRFYVEAGEGGDTVTAIVSSAELCSDGMSDRDYGWAVDFLRRDADGISGLTGCCMRPLD